ncbi:MAG: hypothetical protein ACI9DC_005121 [Gammaproteobacteria bacterium]|jgi:hypothetical protein
MAAMTRTWPPQRAHALMSITNTRRSRCIQLIAPRGLSSCGSPARDTVAMMWRAGVFGVRGKHAVIANQMGARARHQGGKPGKPGNEVRFCLVEVTISII